MLIAGGVAASAVAGPALAGPSDNSVVFGQSIPITDLGPAYGAFLKYPAGYEAAFLLYDRLVSFDADLDIKPQIAESWDVSPDQKTITFHLRKGVTFHDGTPLDAKAVKFNIERMLDPKRNTTNRPLWDPIAGADVVDEQTVAIRTKEPFGDILNTLAHGSAALLSPTALEKSGDESETLNPVGSGPYMLDAFEPGQQLTLKAFPNYWGGKPKLDKVVFKYIPEAATRLSALRTGSVDVIDAVPYPLISSLKNDQKIEIISKPSLRPLGLALLTSHAPYNEVKVRQALNYAVPVKAISDRIFFGYAKPSDSPLAFNTTGYKSIGGYSFDPAKAKALLAEAGFKDSNNDGILDRNGTPLKMTLLTSEGEFPNDVQTTEIAAKSFRDIGIDATISKVERGSYWDSLRLAEAEIKWDAALFGFNPSNGSGTYHLDSLFHSNPNNADRPVAWNITRYKNDEVDALVEEAKRSVDPQKKKEILGKAQEIVWKDAPYVWMHVPEVVSAKRADLKDVEVWPIIFTILRNAHY
jgi:ABC-type transport system substrate-binding protein